MAYLRRFGARQEMSDKSQSHRYDSGVTEPSATRIEQSKLQPGQWTLRHLVIVLAVVAVGSAIVAPWLRQISARQLAFAGLAGMVAMATAACLFGVGVWARKHQVAAAGARLLEVELTGWHAFNWLWWFFLIASFFNLGLSAIFLLNLPSDGEVPWHMAFGTVGQGFNLGAVFGNLLLCFSNANCYFELCEKGLLIQKVHFVPWNKITRMEWTDGPRGALVVYANRIRHILPMDAAGRETVRDLIAAHWSGTQESTAAAPDALSVSR
jgi:hypothetical protein